MLKMVDQDIWVKDQSQLKDMTTSFFKGLYCSGGARNFHPILSQCPSTVSNEMNAKLSVPVSLKEVHQVVFEMGSSKAPGPDGLNGMFFQQNWDSIKMGIFEEIRSFF